MKVTFVKYLFTCETFQNWQHWMIHKQITSDIERR